MRAKKLLAVLLLGLAALSGVSACMPPRYPQPTPMPNPMPNPEPPY